jgi:hypothetical protein
MFVRYAYQVGRSILQCWEKKFNLFRVRVNVMLLDLKDQLDQINNRINHKDTRRVYSVEDRHPSTDSDGSVWFDQMKLQNDDDVRAMFSIFGKHNAKGPNELDASLVRSFKDIRKSLIQIRNYEDIRSLMDILDINVRLFDP